MVQFFTDSQGRRRLMRESIFRHKATTIYGKILENHEVLKSPENAEEGARRVVLKVLEAPREDRLLSARRALNLESIKADIIADQAKSQKEINEGRRIARILKASDNKLKQFGERFGK